MLDFETVFENNNQQYMGEYTEAKVKEIREKIFKFATKDQKGKPLNFLVVGGPGTGKSSLINTIQSAFWDEVVTFADVGSSQQRMKTSYYLLYNNISPQTLQPIQLYDTRGLGNDDHETVLSLCVDGKIPLNSKMVPESAQNQNQIDDHKIHAIIFVTSVKTDAICENLANSVVNVAKRANIPVGVVVAHADLIAKQTDKDTLMQKITDQYTSLFNTDMCTFVHNYNIKSEISPAQSGQVLSFIRTLQQRSYVVFQRIEKENEEKKKKEGCSIS